MAEKEKFPIYTALIVILVIALSTTGYFFTTGRASEIRQSLKEFDPSFGKMHPVYNVFDDVVNLDSPDSFMKIHIIAEINIPDINRERDKYHDLLYDLKKRDSKIKDILTAAMNNYSAKELVTKEGKERLRKELLLRINREIGLFKDGRKKISNLYFTELIVE